MRPSRSGRFPKRKLWFCLSLLLWLRAQVLRFEAPVAYAGATVKLLCRRIASSLDHWLIWFQVGTEWATEERR